MVINHGILDIDSILAFPGGEFLPEKREGKGGSEHKLGPRGHHQTLLLRQKEKPGSIDF